ncbi:hypothetical protein G3R47_04370 [Acinetobacter baumannii]|uniref:hypothetical protein n=1 Tax=Acinetobacter baumannii TaxID=470 RepID=UPI001464285B|nr:hypothetical protein [Acinetobacter baumannii]MCG5791219.1 hypothetical protein [Acinetobacter baumannii]QJP36799.1 hypothetical protein G3R47_04370 [Acinetobacter baumannii]
MDKPITFSEWLGTQGNMVLLHANCCRIAYEAGQQSQQAKVEEQAQEIANLKSLIQGHELRHQQNLSIKQKLTRRSEELQKQLSEYIFVAETIDEMYVKEVQKSDELQKRVEWLEDRLKATDTLSKMRAAVIGSFNSQEFNARTRRKMMILKRAEQALKGEGQ